MTSKNDHLSRYPSSTYVTLLLGLKKSIIIIDSSILGSTLDSASTKEITLCFNFDIWYKERLFLGMTLFGLWTSYPPTCTLLLIPVINWPLFRTDLSASTFTVADRSYYFFDWLLCALSDRWTYLLHFLPFNGIVYSSLNRGKLKSLWFSVWWWMVE